MLPAGQTPANVPGAFTGIYESAGLKPDTLYTVAVEADQDRVALEVRTPPEFLAQTPCKGGFIAARSCAGAATTSRC
jgi:hypothetical protein